MKIIPNWLRSVFLSLFPYYATVYEGEDQWEPAAKEKPDPPPRQPSMPRMGSPLEAGTDYHDSRTALHEGSGPDLDG